MNTIGTLLKNSREKKNISLEEVARRTKININILRSLEQDDIKNLPNKTYVKGFVINFAKTVSLDINDARNALETTYEIKLGGNIVSTQPEKRLGALQADNQEEAETEELKETFNSIIHSLFNKKIIYAVAAILVVGIVLKGIVSFFSSLNFESQVIVDKTIEQEIKKNPDNLKSADENLFDIKATKKLMTQNETKKEVVEAKKDIKKEAVEDKKELKKEAVEAKKEAVEAKKEAVEAKKEVVEAKKEVKKEAVVETKEEEKEKRDKPKLINGKFPFKNFSIASTNLYTLVADAQEVLTPELLPESIKKSKVEGKQNVYIVADKEDTWISYKVDDTKIKRYVLKQGRRLFLKGERILLFMGNFNATKVFLNNELVTAQTRTGVKSLIFPQEAANEYELPLFPSFNGIPYTVSDYKENMAEKVIKKEQGQDS